jgi:hypothetical protein
LFGQTRQLNLRVFGVVPVRLFFIQVANKKRELLLMSDIIGQGKKDLANAYVAGACGLAPGYYP